MNAEETTEQTEPTPSPYGGGEPSPYSGGEPVASYGSGGLAGRDEGLPSSVYNTYGGAPDPAAPGPAFTYGGSAETAPAQPPTAAQAFSEESEEEAVDPNNEIYTSLQGSKRIPRGQISIGKYLAAGAFGQVSRGLWRDHPVALKKIDIQRACKNLGRKEAEIIEALQWEITLLSAASNSNLVHYYGVYQADNEGYSYIVMEFCHQGTVKGLLKKEGGVSWKRRRVWGVQIARGLKYLHREGIIHRDLKCENILVDETGRAKLADLGVSQIDELIEKAESRVVELGLNDKRYVPPENVRQANLSTKETDVYSLGVVFWELTGAGEPRRLRV
uniref:Protein kinase domain-containing protein n=1 Tax=Arcella intermedia TaxID=1963864 RepID=A0A6B2L7Q9_9EUKA